MARNGKKTGGRDFQKGQSGNPEGRPPLPPEVRALRAVNQFEFEKSARWLFDLNEIELQAVVDNPLTKTFDRMIAKLMVAGDYKSYESIWVRTIGRAATQVEVGLTEAERDAKIKSETGDKAPASFADLAARAAAAKAKAKM